MPASIIDLSTSGFSHCCVQILCSKFNDINQNYLIMKKLLLFATFFAFAAGIHAQEVLYAVKLKKEKVPATVIASIEKDFPDAAITEYTAVPVEIVGEDFMINTNKESKDYDTYEVKISGKSFIGTAMYDSQGNLMYSNELIKNTALPYNIRYCIGKNYPGWTVEGDREFITTYRNGSQKSYYHVKLMKGKEKVNVAIDAHGNLMHKNKELHS